MSIFFVNTQNAQISNAFIATLGAAPGSTYLAEIKAAGLIPSVQAMITATGSSTAAALSTKVATNLGLTGTAFTGGTAYLGSVTFAGASSTWAANLMSTLDLFTTLQFDAIYGSAATAYLARVNSAVSYSVVATNNSTDLSTLAAAVGSAGSTGSGSTFTLTTSIDNFPGTSGNDIFIGDNATVSAADTLVGGLGSDTLRLFGNAAAPNYSGIETVFLSGNTLGFDVSAKADVTLLELSDPTTAQTYTVTTGQSVKIDSVATGETVTIAGNTPATLSLGLNAFVSSSTAADATLALTGTALRTLAITTATAGSNVTLTNAGAGLTAITIAGNQRLELGHALTTVTTIDASASTGAVDIDTVGASNLTFTGGSGNDRINMVATLTASDRLTGGAGTDVFAIGDADTMTVLTAANVSGFEVLEVTTADGTAYNVDAIIANNALTGITISETGGAATTVSNINAGALGNIRFTGDAPTAITLVAKDHLSGGTSDAATIVLDQGLFDTADGVDITTTLTFTLVDRLTVNVIADDNTAARAVVNSIAGLTATDLDTLIITGNAAVSITAAATTAALSEVDASASTGAVTFVASAAAIPALIYRGNDKVDTVTIANDASNATTFFSGGGSDVLVLGVTGAAHTLKFNATDFTTGDVKAGQAITLNTGAAFQAADTVTIDFNATFEGLLKFGGVTAAATAADFTLVGAAFAANTNIRAVDGGNNTLFQIDLNGDGAFTAGADFQIEILGLANNTLNYVAATDLFVFTATA